MTPQPLPTNLHPSQCYRLLDHERDTLQDGDETWLEGSKRWMQIAFLNNDRRIHPHAIYRRPFTPPAPVQAQEFWRLLEVGKDTLRAGDQVQFRLGHNGWEWEEIDKCRHGEAPHKNHTYRRRVTVPVAAPAPVADAPKAKPSGDYAAYRERLFKYAEENFGHTLINSEMDEIEHIVLGFFKHKAHEPIPEPPESGPYLVSVDGYEAPSCEHATIEDARAEAERLARQEHPAQVRLLRQVAVAKAEVTVKWEESK